MTEQTPPRFPAGHDPSDVPISGRRLRITVVVGEFPALSETFVLDQVIASMAAGHEVRIIASAPRHEDAVHEEVERYDLLGKTRHLGIPPGKPARLGVIARAVRARGPGLAKALATYGLARTCLGEPGQLAGLAATAEALAEAPRPDVVLCHFGLNAATAVRALDALGWAVPVVTIFHGWDLTKLVQRRGPRLYEHLFRKGRLFLPACDAFADRLRALGCPPDRVAVQRMCVDPARLDRLTSSLDTTGPRTEVFTVTTVGRLVEKKGTIHVVGAFARAFGHLPPDRVRLQVIGDGPLRGDLERAARDAGIADRTHFLGALPRREVLSALLATDVSVQASVTAADGDMEASPVVISEAMALRKPVVGSRHSGIPELIVDGVTGRLVDEGDEAALAAAMSWMFDDRDAAAKMGQAGRERLEAGFTAAHWNALLGRRLLDAASEHTCRG